MIPNDQPLRADMIERMIDFIESNPNFELLSKWEQDFIYSIREQFDKKGDLSNRQCEILERINDKI